MSFTPAKIIASPQADIHKNLKSIVTKHLSTEFKKPIAAYSQVAFDSFYLRWLELGKPKIIVDSACGTGESTRFFAGQYPQCLVVGLDQSAKRLLNDGNKKLADNCLLLRCDCTDFWRIAEKVQIRFEKHFLLYPNPWPKTEHFQRRWQGHPRLPSLLVISDAIELRTNWKIYAQEFYEALVIAGQSATLCRFESAEPITAFERKYFLSGHELWQVKTETN
ncbi:MAG: tRNA G46 methylase TrmB [Glaciecola sp.]|jgi:tRNA G46 methylase TrmB